MTYNKNLLFFLIFTINFIGFSQNITKKELKTYIKKSQKLLEERKYDDLINISKKNIQNYKNNDSVTGLSYMYIGHSYVEKGDYGKAEEILKKSIKILTKKTIHKYAFNSYSSLCNVYYIKGDYLSEKKTCLNIIKILPPELQEKDPEFYLGTLTDAYYGVSRSCHYLNDITNSLTYINKALELTSSEKPLKAAYLSFKGNILNQSRHFDEALKNFEEAIKIITKKYDKDHVRNAIYYANISTLYRNKKLYSKALDYQKKALRIALKNYPKDHLTIGMMYLNLAVYYDEHKQPEKSFPYYEKSLNIYTNKLGEKHYRIGDVHYSIGNYYESISNYEKALISYEKALEIYRLNYGDTDKHIYYVYNNIGLLEQKKGQYPLAINYFKKSIDVLKVNYQKSNYQVINSRIALANAFTKNKEYENTKKQLNIIRKHLSLKQLSDQNYDETINSYLYSKAKINYYKVLVKKNKHYSDSLSTTFNESIKIQNHIHKNYSTRASKEFQIKKAFPIYEDYISHLNKLNNPTDLNKIFTLAETTKSRQLLEDLNNIKVQKNSKLPDTLSQYENKLHLDLAYHQEELYYETNEKEKSNDSLISFHSNKIFELKINQEKLEKTFKTKYPKYYQLRYNTTVSGVKNIQEKLSKKQSLLEYFVGDENIFIFLITKDSYAVKQVTLDFPLKNWVQDLRKGIYGNWSNKIGNPEQYNKLYQDNAFALYEKLIAPIENSLTEEVIIVPDAELNFIPFDALLTNKDDDKSYLIKNHQISYNYSATHYLQLLNSVKKVAPKTVLAVAPSFKNNDINYKSLLAKRSGLSNLEFNIPEAKTISNLFDGTLLESNKATKENFIKEAKDYNIIHLSTHAKSNDAMGEFSYIAFQKGTDSTSINDSRLYVNELYNLNLNADLVVLSACETGLGELKRGEGVVSLARGFTYAGAKSTLTSLWSVNDAQTTKLMESFYTNLKEGMTKDKALRQAKLDYLSNENLTAPYFWAGFIPAGDMSAITSSYNYWYWGIGVFIILLIILYMTNQKKSS